MKKFIIALFTALIYISAPAQPVSQDVLFDNYVSPADNDFANNFSGFTTLYQVPSGGITGGCLVPPDSNLWGNDNAIYCAKYAAQQGTAYLTSIVFRYDGTAVNPGSGDRASSIWLRPSADYNHYLIASITQDRRIQILSYSWVNPTAPQITLQNSNWYELSLQAVFTGSTSGEQIDVTVRLTDLGPTGVSLPFVVGSVTGSFDDGVLIADTSIEVSITGSRWGGAQYLENFHFEGFKGSDNCMPLDVQEGETEPVAAWITDAHKLIVSGTGAAEMNIYDAEGRSVYVSQLKPGTNEFDFAGLPAGLYIISAKREKLIFKKSFLLF